MTRRIIAMASTAAAVAALTGTAALLPATATAGDPAHRAVAFLTAQQRPDGSLGGDVTQTSEFVIAAEAIGGSGAVSAATRWLASTLAAPSTTPPSAGQLGEAALATVAAGLDPHRLTAPGGVDVDLVDAIAATYHPVTGTYGDGGTFAQSLAILGLRAARAPVPHAALAHLGAIQDGDGGWDYLGVRDDPNAAANFDTSDSNSTAIALMALAACGEHSHDTSALAWLTTAVDPASGGVAYQPLLGADPNSTALALQAMVATGSTKVSSLLAAGAAYLTHVQDAGGGFAGYSGTPDVFTTAQVPLALLTPVVALPSRVVADGGPAGAAPAGALHALAYLATQQRADGSVDGSIAETAQYLTGAVALGVDPATLRHEGSSALDFLLAASPGATHPGDIGSILVALAAAGRGPTDAAPSLLLGRLDGAPAYATATGVYGAGQTFEQSLAVLGREAMGAGVPAAAVDHLASAQNSDGGWGYLGIHDDPSAAANFDSSDTNSTAIALEALASAGREGGRGAAVAWLATQRQSDGGFPYSGAPTDADSTALVMAALRATGQAPAAAPWQVDCRQAADALEALQMSGGGYAGYTGSPDAFTTAQVPLALAHGDLPLPGDALLFVPGTALPATLAAWSPPVETGCSGGPLPTATATATPTPTAAASATPHPSATAAGAGAGPTASTGAHSTRATPTTTAAALGLTSTASPAPGPSGAAASPTAVPGLPPILGRLPALGSPSPTGAVAGLTAGSGGGGTPGGSPWLYPLAAVGALIAVAGIGTIVARLRGSLPSADSAA